MTVPAIILIGGGLAAVLFGLPAAHRLARPWDIAAALIFLFGVAAALVGTLLALVPGFFG
ncbi:hypothetical protein [Geobacter pickeringii]|uniref:Uncharacterized protein n=1 Tax=Geobacter pickeringii TaxID=345632 RepID=A0A0B5BBK8_9BACT|nr:hypothetical protein [Geobacter pickeringii]AJE02334.1 hypothetical protein GPICK_02140 [Geobacter pickeringii]